MNRSAVRSRFLVASLLAVMVLSSVAARAEMDFDRVIFFGDSLSDSGNAFVLIRTVSVPPFDLIPSAPYAGGGRHFSNGYTWAEQFAKALHMSPSAEAAFRVPGVFTNYAVGGSRARLEGDVSLSTQVFLFSLDFPVAPSDALYSIVIGGNDVRDAIEAYAIDPSGVTSAQIIEDAVVAIAANISGLAALGATQFLIGNSPDLGLVPAIRMEGPAVQFLATQSSIAFNDALAVTLDGLEAGLGLTIARIDIFQVMNDVVADPAAAGFSEVIDPCLTFDVLTGAVCKHPRGYFFWDGIHPTKAGHAVVAAVAVGAVN